MHPSVRARLQGVQRVTCSLLGVVFEEQTPSELSTKATIIPGAARYIHRDGSGEGKREFDAEELGSDRKAQHAPRLPLPARVRFNALRMGCVGAVGIQELSKLCDVYLVTQCVDDEGQQNVERALAASDLLGTIHSKPMTGVIASHKNLYCGTRCEPSSMHK
eukprot:931513-Pyramimonas_sp.AAC.1